MRTRIILSIFLLALSAGSALAELSLKPGPQLWVYSSKGDTASIQALVQSNAFDKDVLGRALYHNLRRGKGDKPDEQISIIKTLLSYGADVNYTVLNGQTPLIVAANTGNSDAVRVLLENGADAAIVDGRNKKALDYAVASSGENSDSARLIRNPPQPNPVAKAKPGTAPKALNMDLVMQGTDVIVTYDLVSQEPACVSLIGSMDGGKTYSMNFSSSSGDVGRNIPPGNGKRIVWKSKKDYPRGFSDVDVMIDLVVAPCP